MIVYKNSFKRKIIRECLIISILFFLFPIIIQVKEVKGTPQLTSLEAAKLAYQEANKWDPQAVLWYINPGGRTLDYYWGEKDLSWEWSFIFAHPQDEQLFYLEIKENKIISTEKGKHIKRLSPILPYFPKDRPGISMQKAAQAVFAAGAPSWERPSVVYIIDNSIKEYQGKPVWFFLFGSQFSTYTVDGITGKLLDREYFDPKTLKKIEPEEVQYEFYPDKVSKIKEENFIYDFFEAINVGNIEQYFSMMEGELSGNETMREVWKTAFSSLELIKIVSLYPEEEAKWRDKQPLYRAIIYTIPKFGAPYYGWDKGENTRWISIVPSGDSWKITAIATSP